MKESLWLHAAGPVPAERPRVMGSGSGLHIHIEAFECVFECANPSEEPRVGHVMGGDESAEPGELWIEEFREMGSAQLGRPPRALLGLGLVEPTALGWWGQHAPGDVMQASGSSSLLRDYGLTILLVVVSCALGCKSAVPPPVEEGYEARNLPQHDEACESTEGPSRYACTADTDCVVCHDGSPCGRVVNRAERAARGAECEREDSAECESSAPRCCAGRCTIAPF